MENQLNLADVQPVQGTQTYHWNLRLSEFNGECKITYSTNYPVPNQGEVWLVSYDGHSTVKAKAQVNSSGEFLTGQTWGSGYYAIWVINGLYTIAWSPTTSNS